MRSERELLDRVPTLLTEAFGFDRCTLLMDSVDGGLDIVARSWTEEDHQAPLRELMAKHVLRPPPHLRRCITEDRSIFVPDPEADPDWPAVDDEAARGLAQRLGWRSPSLFTPVRCEGKPVGVIFAHTHLRWRPMDQQDISRVEAFAAMVDVALQNVRLLENLNALVDERTRELRDAQAALVQSEKMASMGQLVAGVAHELNTPVGAVTSAQDSMRKAADKLRKLMPDELDKRVDATIRVMTDSAKVVETGSQRIGAIVARLRSFARLDQAAVQAADVHSCIEDAIGQIEHRLSPEQSLERHFGELPVVRCDPRKLNQLFANLLGNAVDAMGEGGTLAIRTKAVDGGVDIEVEDDGAGIPAEHLDKIFDPGFTTKGVGVGTGLGLSIAYGVVEEHGGTIRVESTEGEGTRVIVHLPEDESRGAQSQMDGVT
jgi:signal transduction histidine kinase